MIGLISDTHDNVPGIKKAVAMLKEKNCELVIHAGDIIAGVTIQHFKGLPIQFILGNNQMIEHDRLRKKIENINGILLGESGELDIQGKKMGIFHGHLPDLQEAIDSQKYDYIITGHTHEQRDEMIGKTRVINPGGLYLGDEKHSIAFLDVEKDTLEFVDV